jgi:hypothetical protein
VLSLSISFPSLSHIAPSVRPPPQTVWPGALRFLSPACAAILADARTRLPRIRYTVGGGSKREREEVRRRKSRSRRRSRR